MSKTILSARKLLALHGDENSPPNVEVRRAAFRIISTICEVIPPNTYSKGFASIRLTPGLLIRWSNNGKFTQFDCGDSRCIYSKGEEEEFPTDGMLSLRDAREFAKHVSDDELKGIPREVRKFYGRPVADKLAKKLALIG